jgi:hypothetical protein
MTRDEGNETEPNHGAAPVSFQRSTSRLLIELPSLRPDGGHSWAGVGRVDAKQCEAGRLVTRRDGAAGARRHCDCSP